MAYYDALVAKWNTLGGTVAQNLAAINSIQYIDWITQTQQTLDPSLYVVQTVGESVAIIPKFGTIWPIVFSFASEPIVINFDAGVDDPADVPANVQAAILAELHHETRSQINVHRQVHRTAAQLAAAKPAS